MQIVHLETINTLTLKYVTFTGNDKEIVPRHIQNLKIFPRFYSKTPIRKVKGMEGGEGSYEGKYGKWKAAWGGRETGEERQNRESKDGRESTGKRGEEEILSDVVK
jgi:hypothetical protein